MSLLLLLLLFFGFLVLCSLFVLFAYLDMCSCGSDCLCLSVHVCQCLCLCMCVPVCVCVCYRPVPPLIMSLAPYLSLHISMSSSISLPPFLLFLNCLCRRFNCNTRCRACFRNLRYRWRWGDRATGLHPLRCQT